MYKYYPKQDHSNTTGIRFWINGSYSNFNHLVQHLISNVCWYADGSIRSSATFYSIICLLYTAATVLIDKLQLSSWRKHNMTRYQRSTCHRVAISLLCLCTTMFLISKCLGDSQGILDVSTTPRAFGRNRSGAAVKKIKLHLLPVSRRKAEYCIFICWRKIDALAKRCHAAASFLTFFIHDYDTWIFAQYNFSIMLMITFIRRNNRFLMRKWKE